MKYEISILLPEQSNLCDQANAINKNVETTQLYLFMHHSET